MIPRLGKHPAPSLVRLGPLLQVVLPARPSSSIPVTAVVILEPSELDRNLKKDIVLDIAYNVKAMLEQAGARVVMTRTGDYDPGLAASTGQLTARARTANATGADVFISIHANWNDNPRVRGVETYHYTNSGQGLA